MSRSQSVSAAGGWFTGGGHSILATNYGLETRIYSGPFEAEVEAHGASSLLEILTVLGVGPLCCYTINKPIKNDPARHYWIIILSTAELNGGWMTFCPEWLTGSPNLDTSNAWSFWIYLVFMNIIWAPVPLWLMWDSYHAIAGSLRSTHKAKSS